jgi:hypothetical protein
VRRWCGPEREQSGANLRGLGAIALRLDTARRHVAVRRARQRAKRHNRRTCRSLRPSAARAEPRCQVQAGLVLRYVSSGAIARVAVRTEVAVRRWCGPEREQSGANVPGLGAIALRLDMARRHVAARRARERAKRHNRRPSRSLRPSSARAGPRCQVQAGLVLRYASSGAIARVAVRTEVAVRRWCGPEREQSGANLPGLGTIALRLDTAGRHVAERRARERAKRHNRRPSRSLRPSSARAEPRCQVPAGLVLRYVSSGAIARVAVRTELAVRRWCGPEREQSGANLRGLGAIALRLDTARRHVAARRARERAKRHNRRPSRSLRSSSARGEPRCQVQAGLVLRYASSGAIARVAVRATHGAWEHAIDASTEPSASDTQFRRPPRRAARTHGEQRMTTRSARSWVGPSTDDGSASRNRGSARSSRPWVQPVLDAGEGATCVGAGLHVLQRAPALRRAGREGLGRGRGGSRARGCGAATLSRTRR